ncbi:MAG: SUF system NifU family Fe-S cluster assembly protein [Candidatus Lindowbacteria bacterium RIFCSPLOWO2_12_FULL_62_27]|nr:MAG: SUF system NifU family Fe-S cluster assembly protein [Candidatus Lindowbacteria bacterium RIFCSPLOWO2_02_FULL_62_12]OGH62445.1 MAG: SUF system NifU family Fe-S cluster assembly protein [Candidatus Lindowbacteria bacterium RIFCSPLOWO2_12_FULL_62_27]
MSLEGLYQEIILDHYKAPRNRGSVENPDIDIFESNPLCGDEIRIQAKLDGRTIQDIRFEGKGCSISLASASMMTEALKGHAHDHAHKYIDGIKAMMHGEDKLNDEELGDMEALKGVADFPARVKCALLAWTTLEKALNDRAARKG